MRNKEYDYKFTPLPAEEYRRSSEIVVKDGSNQISVIPIVRLLINKFLNEKFLKNESNLNHHSESMERTNGFMRWDTKRVVEHIVTSQYSRALYDKYGYNYENGKHREIPLAFYFDLSGSMLRFSTLLATIALELLKKDVNVLLGFNNRVVCQVEWVKENLQISQFSKILRNLILIPIN